MIERNFNLHLTAGHSTALVINANQFDQGEKWIFTLYNENGTQYIPSTGAIVGIKSDGLGIINSGSVVDGKVVIMETEQMTAAVGKAVFELMIDSQTHGTANFIVLVEPKPGNNADLSESDLSLLQEAIDATSPLPTGGSVGQVLTKTASGSTWSDAGTPTQAQVAEAVSDWADENITVTTGVVIDTSLSVAGAAADAKKTGDEINDLKSAIGDLSELETESKTDLVSAINDAASTGGASYGLPRMNIDGDLSLMTNSKNEVTYPYSWIDGDDFRTGWVVAKVQGNSSTRFPKKNYTFKFYNDSDVARKDKCDFFGLGTKSKWVGKANYIDHSHSRNVISARLWGDIVKSRKTAPPTEMINSPNYGATNGYPFELYNNGDYWGLYTMIVPKDDWMFGMDEDNPLHCVMQGDANNDGDTSLNLATEFRSVSTSGWECEMPETLSADVRTGFLAMISFVLNSTDEEFKANLNDYIDVESAIDYYLFAYFIGASDSLAKNLAMLTYDGGTKWYCSYWDMDSTWGLRWDGSGNYYPTNMACPEDYQDTNSLLWQRMEALYFEELIERYNELRASVLKLDYINRMFEQFINYIGSQNYYKDVQKWSGVPHKDVDQLNQIETWAAGRAVYVDAQIGSLDPSYVPCTGVTLNQASYTLGEDYNVKLTATPTPSNTSDILVWSSSDESVAVVKNGGLVTRIGAGTANITVTCGAYSATCVITVPQESLPAITWTGSSNINSSTGAVVSGDSYVSNMLNLNEYAGAYLPFDTTFNWVRYAYYNESDDSLSKYYQASDATDKLAIFGFENTKVRVGAHPVNSSSDAQNIIAPLSIEYLACGLSYNTFGVANSHRYQKGKEIHSFKPIPVDGGDTYTVTGNGTVTYLSILEYDESMTFIKKSEAGNTTQPLTVKVSNNCAYIRLHCYYPTSNLVTATDQATMSSLMTLSKV